jgi:cytochrome c oxidase assembly factor CtaG
MLFLAAGASGYHGPPELTFARAVTSWTFDPWALAGIAVLGTLYVAGVRRLRRRGELWPASRPVLFCGLGLGFGVIATMSAVGVYEPVLFYVRSVQTVLLLLVVPLFLALGRPLSLIIAASPAMGRRLESALRGRTARLLTFPALTTFVLILTPFLMYFTPWYGAGFTSGLVAQLTRVALMAPGFLFFWTLLQVDPVPRPYPYVLLLWITAAEVIGDAVLGIAVIANANTLAGPYYHAVGRPWGPSLATSQVIGGGVLWILGDLVGLPFLAAQLIQMMRADEADARAIDAELDAQDAVVASAGLAALAGTGAAGTAGTAASDVADEATEASTAGGQRPWWETDRRFSGRFRALDDSG